MANRSVTVGGLIGGAGFALTPVFFFLEFPVTGHELGLMVVAAIYGICFGVLVASIIWYFAKSAKRAPRATRSDRIHELEIEIVVKEQAIAECEGEKTAAHFAARDARANGWDDFHAQYTASAKHSEIELRALQVDLDRARAELTKVREMHDREWAKEARRA